MNYLNPLYEKMKAAQRAVWNYDGDEQDDKLKELDSQASQLEEEFEAKHGHIWVLFTGQVDKLEFPNFSPVMVSRDADKLRQLAESMPEFYNPSGPSYQLFELPLDTLLGESQTDRFYGMLGNFHHEHLQDEA